MHARALLSIHDSPPPLVTWPRTHVLFALLFIALSSLLPAFLPTPLHAAPRLATCPTGSVIYVAKEAPGIQSGNSWFTAFVTLQDALAAAAACPGVQQIWVKEGIYYPDEGKGQVANSTAAAFVVPPGVALYGGFSGSELLLTQRSLPDHPTILSGDVDHNDTNTDGNFIVEASSQIQGANAYHVLWLNGTAGTPITGTTRIDGFTITGGYANGFVSTETGGGGLYCLGRSAGSQCSPTLANLVFAGNKASYHGGALYADGSEGGDSSPIVVNVAFIGNSARYNGGALYSGATKGTSSPLITNVTFYANAGGNGGGVYNDGSGGTSQPVLTNVILWGNTASTSGAQMFNAYAAPTLAYSLIQGGGSGIYNHNSSLTDGGGVGNGDPRFVDAAHADLRLLLGSAGRDTGTNEGAPAVDIRGLPRPINDVVDIGAYEAQPYRLTLSSGDKQKIGVTEAFTLPLVVTLTSPYEWLEPGAVVTYMPPPSGAGLAVTEPWLVPVDANGQASSTVHANNVAGRYAVTVTTGGLITPVVFTLTNTPLSVSVARTGTGKGLVISSPAGVVCAPLCAAGFDYGRLVTFTATANTGSIFTGWVDDTAGGTYSTPDPDTAAMYTALADAMPDSVAAAVPGGVSGGVPGSDTEAVSSSSVVAAPSSGPGSGLGSEIKAVSGSSVEAVPSGGPGSGHEAVPVDGLSTALLAAAREHAVLDAVGSAEVAGLPSSGSLSFSVTSSRLITATFALSHYTVDVAADPAEGGTAAGAGTFAYATPLTVTAEANVGYRFLYWTMNGTAVTTTAAYSFTLKGDRTLVAMFTPLPTAVDDTATVGSGQAITISVLANDLDPVAALSSSNGGMTVVITTVPAAGTATISADRTSVVYTPSAGFVGNDTFTYTAVDANASTATGHVTVLVTAAAPPPPAPGTDPPAPDISYQLYLPDLGR